MITEEFPVVRIHLSTYIKLVRRYIDLVWDAGEPWGSPKHPNVGFTYCQNTGRILAYPIGFAANSTPGSWFNLGAIGYPFYDKSLLEYEGVEKVGVRRGYVGWSRIGGHGIVESSSWDEGTHLNADLRGKVLYEIVIVPDSTPEDLSVLGWLK